MQMSDATENMSHQIIPPSLAIKAMRDSGYKNAAHAIAELIDNSIQAGLEINEKTSVEVLCLDKTEHINGRNKKSIDNIAVYDNAIGMNAVMLRQALAFGRGAHLKPADQKGMGKFGMGLPNSSISQCRRVEVWSWQQDGPVLFSYLDIDEIQKGDLVDVPEPVEKQLPSKWKKMVSGKIGPHGTLVVWSKIDYCQWRTSEAFFRNSEALVGRMYREFINQNKASIRMAAFEETDGQLELRTDTDAQCNDPLGLMTNSICPAPWDSDPPFEQFGKIEHIDVTVNGEEHIVEIKYSMCTQAVRTAGGGTPIGRWAQKNRGISLMRSDREIELSTKFDNGDYRERWWGIEVSFPPALDNFFGVTNNKQSCTNFDNAILEDDAQTHGMSTPEYRELLEEEQDPKLMMYEISKAINGSLKTLRQQIIAMKEGGADNEKRPQPTRSEEKASDAKKERIEDTGKTGVSDEQAELITDDQRTKQLTERFVEEGHPEDDAKTLAVEFVKRRLSFHFYRVDFPGGAIFDVSTEAGVIHIGINSRHPASEALFDLVGQDPDPQKTETPALTAVRLLLTAWGQMEDESSPAQRAKLEDTRAEWGRIAKYGFSDELN